MILAELVNANARLGQPQSYVSFYRPAYLSGLAYTLLGLNAVITWVKTLKYLNQFPHLSMVRPMTLLALGSARLTSACAQLSLTLRNAYYPTVAPPPPPRALPDSCARPELTLLLWAQVSFLIMFFIIFLGCGQAFNMAVRNLTRTPTIRR